MLFRSFDFLRHYRLSTPGYESKLPWARTGTVPRRLTLGVTLNHKSNLVPSGSIGPPHHMSVGLYEAMGMSTFFSLLRDVETNNRQKYITPSLTASILPGYCDCAGKVHAVFPPPPFFSYAQASFSHPRVQESMLAVSSRRTYDCHLKEALLSSSSRYKCGLSSGISFENISSHFSTTFFSNFSVVCIPSVNRDL